MPLDIDRCEPPELPREIWSDGAMSVSAAAEFVGSSRKWLFDEMRAGRLAWGRLGERRKIPRRALIDMLAGQSAEASS